MYHLGGVALEALDRDWNYERRRIVNIIINGLRQASAQDLQRQYVDHVTSSLLSSPRLDLGYSFCVGIFLFSMLRTPTVVLEPRLCVDAWYDIEHDGTRGRWIFLLATSLFNCCFCGIVD